MFREKIIWKNLENKQKECFILNDFFISKWILSDAIKKLKQNISVLSKHNILTDSNHFCYVCFQKDGNKSVFWNGRSYLDFQIPALLRVINDPSSVNSDSIVYMITRHAICIAFRFSLSPFLLRTVTINPHNCNNLFTFWIITSDQRVKFKHFCPEKFFCLIFHQYTIIFLQR